MFKHLTLTNKSELAEAISKAALQAFFKSSGFDNMHLITRKNVAPNVLNELKNCSYDISTIDHIIPKSMFIIDDNSYIEINKKYVVSIKNK